MRRTQLTARASMLAAAIVTVTLALALPFKVWLSQRNDITSLAAHNAAIRHHIVDLQHQLTQWNEPAYVERQARVRLHYVSRGQTAYVVIGAHHKHQQPKPKPANTDKPWYSTLWSSAQQIGN